MKGHVRSARPRNRVLLIGFLSLGACAQEGAFEAGALEGELTAAAGSAATCMRLDEADTVPDGIDEDCDGKIDENVDATKANCPQGTRVIVGTRGNDTLRGGSGRDCILGYGGDDVIYGEAGDDLIFGGPGNDRIFPGRGSAIVRAGSGDDFVDTTDSTLSLVYGDAGNDTLAGGSGIDTLTGGDGNDRLSGGGGPDVLSGGNCHDLLVGGGSVDLGTGNADFDVCDTEVAKECEKNGRTRVLCTKDSECPASDRCAVHTTFCVPRTAKACGSNLCMPTGTVDSTCNGVDDDCDGAIDDDFVSTATSCGVGSCGALGETSCVAGQVIDSCSPSSPVPNTDSVCNGVDDDCDGSVDEGFELTDTSCGIGICSAVGMRMCVSGAVVDSCRAGTPNSSTDSVCNGADDDCDGRIDEEFASAATSCGVGVCAATGVTGCVMGALVDSCQPGAPISSTDATCNGSDDDCDGTVDDDFASVATSCGYGACATSGVTACAAGLVIDTCHVVCEGNCADGGEDDGDGLVDCADTDCSENALWPQCVTGRIGSPCQANSECLDSASSCEISFPGGYCFKDCAGGCPTGSVCYEGIACVQPCVGPAEDRCPRPEHACRALVGSPMRICRPTCVMSCPSGTTCNSEAQCS